jgi:hypothetical protein
MEYRFTGDVSGATAALQELKARLSDINRDSMKFAREAAKGDADARQSLLQRVAASDQLKAKVRDLTSEVQRFQKASETAASSGWFTKPNMQQISGAMTGLAFGVDDFVQQWANTGRLSEGIRAAGNNLTMLASLFGPVAVVATAAGTAVATFWVKSIETNDEAKEKLEQYKKSFEDLAKAEARGRGITDDRKRLDEAGQFVLAAEAKEKKANLEYQFFKDRAGPEVVGMRLDDLQKAREELRVARAGKAQIEKEVATKEAEQKFGGMKEGLGEKYKDLLAKGFKPETAKEIMFMESRKNAATPLEQEGLKGVIGKVATETETGIASKAMARGLQDPKVQQAEQLKTEIERKELAIHAMEREAAGEARAQNRRGIRRADRNEIGEAKDAVQVQKDQLKALERLIDETKKAREEKLINVVVPKGLGVAN